MKLGLAIDLGSGEDALPSRLDRASHLLAVAEDLGYESVWIGETYSTASGGMHLPGSLLVLAALSSRTSLGLGTGVLLFPAWHPLKLAYEVALLDQISGGRLTLGFGIGRASLQHRFDKDPATIGRYADETLAALRALWAGKQGYSGSLVTITGGIAPLPIQKGGPPILIGGSIRKSAERAARYGDGYHGSTSYALSHIRAQVRLLRAAWSLSDADSRPAPLVHANRLTVVADSEAEAERLGRRYAGAILEQYHRMGSLDRLGLPKLNAAEIFDRLREEFCIVGTPATVGAQIEAYAAAGVDQLDLRVMPAGMPLEAALKTIRLAAASIGSGAKD